MSDKYTIRDFLVYFITGLFLLVTLLYRFGTSLLGFFGITITDIKDNYALTIFLLVPGLYILGHLVHAIDLLFLKSGKCLWKLKVKYSLKPKKFIMFWILNFFNFVFNGNRVTGILNAKPISTSGKAAINGNSVTDVLKAKKKIREQFWKRVHELRYKGKDNLEYWYLMSDLFKGLTLICIAWTISYSYELDIVNIIMYATFAILFWYRARYMAKTFVSTINNTRELQETKDNKRLTK